MKFIIIAVITFMVFCGLNEYMRYQATVKYYPNLTYLDFCLLGDKIKITPTGDGR